MAQWQNASPGARRGRQGGRSVDRRPPSRLRRSGLRGLRARRGAVMSILVALLGFVFIGMLGLSIDKGYTVLVSHQLQNAADAASLAGAARLREDVLLIRQAAMNIALENRAAGETVLLTDNPTNDPNGEIVIGLYDPATRVFTPSLTGRNAVKVVASRTEGSLRGPVDIFFGPVFGKDTVSISFAHYIGKSKYPRIHSKSMRISSN